MTATHTHRNDRPSLLAFGAAVAIGTTLVIVSLQHVLLASRQPKDTLMDSMLTRARGSYLRSHPRQDFMPATDLSGQDGFFSTDAVAKRAERDDFFPSSGLFDWHDEFFSPFLESPFLKEFQRQHHMLMMEPAFKMDEDGDQGERRRCSNDVCSSCNKILLARLALTTFSTDAQYHSSCPSQTCH